MLTQQRLKELLFYCEYSGVFFRVAARRGAAAGSISGSINKTSGYVMIKIDGENYCAHRLAWLYMTGSMPSCEIDHANNNQADNRWFNLRLCSHAQNANNRRLASNNTSGHKGVLFDRRVSKWFGCVRSLGRSYYTKRYHKKSDAVEAAARLREAIHGDFANHG